MKRECDENITRWCRNALEFLLENEDFMPSDADIECLKYSISYIKNKPWILNDWPRAYFTAGVRLYDICRQRRDGKQVSEEIRYFLNRPSMLSKPLPQDRLDRILIIGE